MRDHFVGGEFGIWGGAEYSIAIPFTTKAQRHKEALSEKY
jgi:hypothetical protein